jgi:hypothetical protein
MHTERVIVHEPEQLINLCGVSEAGYPDDQWRACFHHVRSALRRTARVTACARWVVGEPLAATCASWVCLAGSRGGLIACC